MPEGQGQNLHNDRGGPGKFAENDFPELGGGKHMHLPLPRYFYEARYLIADGDMRVGIAADRYAGGYGAASEGIDTDGKTADGEEARGDSAHRQNTYGDGGKDEGSDPQGRQHKNSGADAADGQDTGAYDSQGN